MEQLPACLNIDYKSKHKVLYSKVMNQLKKYRLKTVFIETLDDDESCALEWKRIPSIDINDIDSTPYEILSLTHDKGNTRSNSWSRQYGGVL